MKEKVVSTAIDLLQSCGNGTAFTCPIGSPCQFVPSLFDSICCSATFGCCTANTDCSPNYGYCCDSKCTSSRCSAAKGLSAGEIAAIILCIAFVLTICCCFFARNHTGILVKDREIPPTIRHNRSSSRERMLTRPATEEEDEEQQNNQYRKGIALSLEKPLPPTSTEVSPTDIEMEVGTTDHSRTVGLSNSANRSGPNSYKNQQRGSPQNVARNSYSSVSHSPPDNGI
jgi:hypothetical protein